MAITWEIKMLNKAAAIAILSLVPLHSFADDGLPVKTPAECLASGPNMTPAKCLVSNAQTRFVLCGFSMGGIRYGTKPSKECELTGAGRLEEHYEATVASFAANAPAVSMTKDYYAYWLSAMGALFPGAESQAAYKMRTDRLQFELIQMGNRLRLEK